jgi:hypothetical protein
LALNSGAWFFIFVILDRLSLQAIHFDKWSEIPRPPLQMLDFRARPIHPRSNPPDAGTKHLSARWHPRGRLHGHVRRRLDDVHRAQGSAIAGGAIGRIGAVLRCRTGGAWIAPDHRIEIRQAKTKPNFDALEVWLHTKAAQYLGQVAAGRGDPLRADPHGADAPISRSRPSGAEHQHRGARDAFGCDRPEDLPVRWLARPAAMPLPSPKP